MKVVCISNIFGMYARGGAERVVEEQIAEMKAQGNEVIIITAKPFFSKQTGEKNIYSFFPLNLFFYTNLSKHGTFVRLLWHVIDAVNMYAMVRVLLMLLREKPDEIHTHNLKGIGLLSAYAVRLSLRVLKKSGQSNPVWIHTVHDIQLITPSGVMIYNKENAWEHTNIFTRAYRAWCRLIFGSPDQVRFPSEWCKKYYERFGFFKKSKREVMRNTVYRASFVMCSEEKQPRDVSHITRYVYAGQLEPHKGVRELIEAFVQMPDKELHVYGSGSIEEELKIKVQNVSHIYFHGRVSQEELRNAYAVSDVLVYPSLCYENAPMSIVEAKTYGLRVIASHIGGIPELLDSNDIALTPGNSAMIIEAICNIKTTTSRGGI